MNKNEKIEDLIDDDYLLKWFKQTNNLIGFCAGVGKSYSAIKMEPKEEFKSLIQNFEFAFESFDISKIKLGHLRRLTVQYFISHYPSMKSFSKSEIADSISQATMLYM